jgi:FKBP-type peptidyl-prolyl cis-trans isomerase
MSLVVLSGCAGAQERAGEAPLRDHRAKFSYSLGIEIAQGLVRQRDEIDLDAFMLGVTDRFHGKPPRLSIDEIDAIKQAYVAKLRNEQAAALKQMADKNKAAGDKFLKENAAKEGVVTTESGLQHLVLKEGTGAKPGPADRVKVNYRGTLLNGEEFDSSYRRGQSATFPLDRVIKGWREGIQLMKVGGKSTFFVPANLAYGSRGAPPKIGPHSVLVFEVELLGIEE